MPREQVEIKGLQIPNDEADIFGKVNEIEMNPVVTKSNEV